jgi:hypothetical protein
MPLVDNTFISQSKINDENKNGGALPGSTGGADGGGGGGAAGAAAAAGGATTSGIPSPGSGFSLDSVKGSILTKLNSVPAGSLFQDGKFVFPKELSDKFNVNNLLNSITSAVDKNLPFSSLFKDGIQGIFGNFLSQLKMDSSETWAFLKSATGTFGQTLADKVKGLLLSRIYVPDVVFLAGLYPLAGIGSNVAYKNHYVRNLCFKHDMPLSLAYIDSLEGIRYTVENNKAVSEASKAARYGSFNVAIYIMRELYSEIKELEGCYPLPKNYDRKTQEGMKANYQNKINESNKIIEYLQSITSNEAALNMLPQYKQAKSDYEENTKMMNALSINREDNYLKDPMYKKVQTLIDKGYKNLYKIMKMIIVNSYSNLTPQIVDSTLKEFNLSPRAFGTGDTKYGQVARIGKSDLNTMLPFFKPKKGKSLMGSASDVSKKSSLIPDYNPVYIKPRNRNNKNIYILLASKTLNKEYMNNKEWYERLQYPVYSTLIQALDESYAGLLDNGLGKTLVGVIKTIEEAFYIYGKSMEPYLFNPSSVEYISYNDFKSLPIPDEEEKKNNKNKEKNNKSNSKTSPVNTAKAATGPKVPSEVDPYDELVDSMNEEELNAQVKSYGEYNDQQVSKMSTEKKRKYLKRKYRETEKPIDEVLDSMSNESLKRYLISRGYKESDVNSYTKSQLKSYARSETRKFELDYSTNVSSLMLADDMKRYVRKYSGAKEGEFMKKSDEYCAGRFRKLMNSQERKIYYPYTHEICDYDAQGFPILGYPESSVIVKAIENNEIGSYKDGVPNAYPVTSEGHICPIIGYDNKGKAIYGTPIFYCDIDPIGSDSRQRPVFAYYKDRAILDDNNLTEGQVNEMIISNIEKIKTLQSYIDNGASGFIKTKYEKEIQSAEKTKTDLEDMLKYMLIKPVIGYDEYGNRVFGETDMVYNMQNPDGYSCIGYDNNGKLIYEYTEEGKSVIGYDKNSNNIYGSGYLAPFGLTENDELVFGFDMNNKPIYGFTINAEPVIAIEKNGDGSIKSYTISETERRPYIGRTKEGRPIFDYDVLGNKIIGYDADGNQILNPMNKREVEMYYNEYSQRSAETMLSVREIVLHYVIDNKYDSYYDENYNPISENSESLVNGYINTAFKNGSLLKDINENENRSNWISDAQMTLLGSYKVQIDTLEKNKNVFGRLKDETPTPPIIGIDLNNIPILGNALIVKDLDNPPKLVYSSEDASDYGFKKTSPSDDSLDDDFDVVRDYAKAEQLLMKSLSGKANTGRVIELVYGITETPIIPIIENSSNVEEP